MVEGIGLQNRHRGFDSHSGLASQRSTKVVPLAHNQVCTGSTPVAATTCGDGVTASIAVSKTADLSSNLSPCARLRIPTREAYILVI